MSMSGFPIYNVVYQEFIENNLKHSDVDTAYVSSLIMECIHNPSQITKLENYSVAKLKNTQFVKTLSDILMTRDAPIPKLDKAVELNENNRRKTRPWKREEDYRLYMGVYLYGVENWFSVSKFVGNGRNRSQCNQRWSRGLDPRISKQPWSIDEERLLRRMVDQYGVRAWTRISSEFDNRSDVQCRYKWIQIVRQERLDDITTKQGLKNRNYHYDTNPVMPSMHLYNPPPKPQFPVAQNRKSGPDTSASESPSLLLHDKEEAIELISDLEWFKSENFYDLSSIHQ